MGNKSKKAKRGTRDHICIYIFYFFPLCLLICVYVCAHVVSRVELAGVGSLLLPHRSWRLNSGLRIGGKYICSLDHDTCSDQFLKLETNFGNLLCHVGERNWRTKAFAVPEHGLDRELALPVAGLSCSLDAGLCQASWDPCSLLFG